MQSAGDVAHRTLAPPRLNATHVTLAAITVVILMQIELVFTKSINWDEFFHFNYIHRHLQGLPTPWLQVPFVWLFSWVPSLPGDNITHIQVIRLLILPFELAAVGAIVACARSIVGRQEALLCGLFYVTGGYVFLHAFALRADMIAASLLTVALCIALCRPLRAAEIASVTILIVLAFISTIKSVFYAPAFLGVALYRVQKPSHRWIVAVAAVVILTIGALILWVAPLLPGDGVAGILRDVGHLGRNAIDRMFSAGLFPQRRWLLGQMFWSPVLSLTVVLAVVTVFWKGREPRERVLLVSLLLPLCTVAVYRNAYPYYFVFILPPVMIAIAPAVGMLARRYGQLPLILCLLATAVILSASEDRSVLERQRTIQAGIHEIFPTPVTYIDDCGIIGDFPRAVNHYASGWALVNYRSAGQPTYRMAMETTPVPLVLADTGLLGSVCFDFLYRAALLPEDHKAIRENYVQHWGNVFVAGKRIPAGSEEESFYIMVPGSYTVEGGKIVVDGTLYAPGSVIELSRGPHVASGGRLNLVTLRWGENLHRPAYPWPRGAIFTEF